MSVVDAVYDAAGRDGPIETGMQTRLVADDTDVLDGSASAAKVPNLHAAVTA